MDEIRKPIHDLGSRDSVDSGGLEDRLVCALDLRSEGRNENRVIDFFHKMHAENYLVRNKFGKL